MSSDPTTWDLSGGAPFVGHDDALVAMIESLRRYGAISVELGYRWDDAWGPDSPTAEPPADAAITWYADIELQSAGRTRKQRTRWHDVAEYVAPPGGDHARAQIEALMMLVRRRGGHVTVVDL